MLEKHLLPGHGYFKRIEEFREVHCRSGKYFLDFQCRKCVEKSVLCILCTEQTHITQPFFFQPSPDYSCLPKFHYCRLEELPGDVKQHTVNHFQPRVQLKKLFLEGKISSKDQTAINGFEKKYLVDTSTLIASLVDMELKKLKATKKSKKEKDKREVEKGKRFKDYNWDDIIFEGKLRNQSIAVMNKYLDHFALQKPRSKNDKVNAILVHCKLSAGKDFVDEHQAENHQELQDDSDEENDIITATFDETDSENESSNDELDELF